MAIALLAGFTVGLSPSASAHKDTNTVAVVNGEVVWPEGPKSDFDLGDEWRDTSDLSILDLRHPDSGRPQAGDPLNGCRLKDGNSAAGLPLGTLGGPPDDDPPLDPLELAEWLTEKGEPRTFDNHDLCFLFTGFTINAAGWYENRLHATEFDCEASGTSGATGAGGLGLEPPDPGTAVGLGAFYGEFVCDGEPLTALGHVPEADGHFHGLTAAGTTIAFLGVVHCTGERDLPGEDTGLCPTTLRGPDPKFVDSTDNKPVNESRIKHTLACKGEVVPSEYVDKHNSFLDDVSQEQLGTAVLSAEVVLECVIA